MANLNLFCRKKKRLRKINELQVYFFNIDNQ